MFLLLISISCNKNKEKNIFENNETELQQSLFGTWLKEDTSSHIKTYIEFNPNKKNSYSMTDNNGYRTMSYSLYSGNSSQLYLNRVLANYYIIYDTLFIIKNNNLKTRYFRIDKNLINSNNFFKSLNFKHEIDITSNTKLYSYNSRNMAITNDYIYISMNYFFDSYLFKINKQNTQNADLYKIPSSPSILLHGFKDHDFILVKSENNKHQYHQTNDMRNWGNNVFEDNQFLFSNLSFDSITKTYFGYNQKTKNLYQCNHDFSQIDVLTNVNFDFNAIYYIGNKQFIGLSYENNFCKFILVNNEVKILDSYSFPNHEFSVSYGISNACCFNNELWALVHHNYYNGVSPKTIVTKFDFN